MQKRKKVLILGIIAAAAVMGIAAALLLFFAKGYTIRFEEAFSDSLSFEYGQEADIPSAYVVNRFGIRQPGKVEYHFVSPEGEENVSNYPVATCDSVGDWALTCTYESAKVEKTFKVVDTVAPEIILGELPSDVYVGNTDTEYTVPAVDFKDVSQIDYSKCSAILYFEGEEAKYDTLTNAFVPEKDGEYVYKIKAADIYGNTSEAECKWRSKDPNWKDTELPEGYLATFDSVGYTNLISSGFVNEYWSGTEVEEYLEEYEGETGVLKVTAKYNSVGFTAFQVKLAATITPEELGDNVVIVRYRIDDKKAGDGFNLAGRYQDGIKSAASKSYENNKGEWQTAVLTADDLTSYQYVDEDGVLRELTVGLSGTGKTVDVYLASITIGKKLDAPEDLRISGGKLQWNDVKNANGYLVYTEGAEEEEEIENTSYDIGEHKLFKVKAKGDGLFTVDSKESIYVNDTPAQGYLAEFDEEFYQYLVWNNGTRAEGGMDWYECDSFEATYDEEENAVRLDMTRGYVSAGIVVRFPKPAATDELDSVVIRFKADENVKHATVYQYGGPALLADVKDIQEGWNTIVVPKKMLVGDADDTSKFSGYQIMFYETNEPEQGPGQGTEMTVYLSSVTKATQLAMPTDIQVSGENLVWSAVEHAAGYAVSRDGGKAEKVSQNSCNVGGSVLFQISAVGDNKFYVDSEEAVYVNEEVTPGYLAEFNRPYYEYLIWNNGADAPGGMQWYQSESFKAAYMSESETLRVDMTMGYVGAGSVLKFPKSVKVSELNDVVIRMNLDSAVKAVAIYQYGGVGRMYYTEEVTEGWNNIAIPHSSLLADGGSEDVMSGMQIILYGANGNGGDVGKTTTMFLESITNATRLAEPKNLQLEGNTLTWDAVSGAGGYEVIEDGNSYTVNTNSYTTNGGKLLKVAAIGDGIMSVSSGYAIYVNTTLPEGYIATFDEPFYEYLIWNDGENAQGGMQWYNSQSHEVTYDAETKTTKVSMTMGIVGAGSVLKFPKSVKVSELNDVVVRVKLDSAVKAVAIYQYGGVGRMYYTEEVTEGWNNIAIPHSSLLADGGSEDVMSGMQIILYGGNGNNGDVGKATTMYLGSITNATRLEEPQNLQLKGKTLTWDKVSGASKYEVIEDGKSYTVKKNSYKIKGGNLLKVAAIGDGIKSVSSGYAVYVNGTVEEGYIATFDKAFYEYLIWNNGENAEGGMQWYDSQSHEVIYDAKTKTTKVSMTMGIVGAGSVLKFPKSVKVSELNDVVVRVKLDSAVKAVAIYQYGGVGRMYYTEEVTEGWNNIAIPHSALLADAGSEDAMSGMQIILYGGNGNNGDVGKATTMYLGSITNATRLEEPQNLQLKGKTLTWDKVSGASKYEVIEDGKSYTVKKNSYKIKGGNLLKVAAIGDGIKSVSSGYAVYVNGTVEEGYIATFDKAFYEYLIWNNGENAEGGMQWYDSQSHEVTYDAKTKTTKVSMTMGYVGAGSVIKFPKAVKLSEIDDLIIHVKLDSAVKSVAVYQYGGIGNIYQTDEVASGWNDIVIPKDKLLADAGSEDSMSGIQLILYGGNGNGGDVGKKTTMQLGYIASIRRLEAPTNLKVSGNKLTWDKVSGAEKYIVYEDGKAYTTKTNSHTLKGGELLKVQAIGDGKVTADSELTLYINAKVKEGYLAECNKEYYEYLIWNNGANAPGGMQWYDSATFKVQYNKSDKVMDVTAQYGLVGAGIVLKFPQAKALEKGKDVVIDIKLDSTVKNIRFYPYGQTGKLYQTADVKKGWNRIVIPADDVYAAVGDHTFDGIQIVACDNVDGAFTVTSPAETAKISLGSIYYAEALAKPILTVEGDKVKWEPIAKADAYDVYINNKKQETVTATEYSLAGLADGVYQIQVVARSNNDAYLDAASDSVKYSNLEILSVPSMTYNDGTVSFAAVAGAAGYKIEIDGTEYDVDKSATSVRPADLISKSILVKYRMKSIGDNVKTVDSDWSEYQIHDLSLAANMIADYDEGYTKLLWNNGAGQEGGQAWYESDAFSTEAVDEGIKLTMTHGYVCAGFITKFPNPIKIADVDNALVLRIKLDANIKRIDIFEYGGTGRMIILKDLKEGWNELTIPKSALKNDPGKDYISGLQVVMHTSNDPENGDSQGTKVTAILGSVSKN